MTVPIDFEVIVCFYLLLRLYGSVGNHFNEVAC